MRASKFALLCLSLFYINVAAAQPAAGPVNFSVAPAKSTLSYEIVHKLHKVRGVSKKLEGKARVLSDGKAQVMLRVSSESFDSSNVNRDAHVKEVVEAAKYPSIDLKAGTDGLVLPTTFPATVEKTFKAQISFHGVQKMIDLPVKLNFDSADSVHVQVTLNLSLDEFKIERPSLMFVKVDDAMKIDADVVLTKG